MMNRHVRLIFTPSRYERILPAVGWTLLIAVLNSIPGNHYPEVNIRFADKWVHTILYIPIGLLYARMFLNGMKGHSRAVLISVLAGISLGALDELHQQWIPLRSCSLSDWIVDVISVTAGVMAFYAIWRSNSRTTAEI
jgi:VanZ family protein